jgi:hypothetical protein
VGRFAISFTYSCIIFITQILNRNKMKKLLIAALLFAGTFSFANAQTKQKHDTKKATTTAATTKTAPAKVDKSTTTTKHLKADGTPDKRYKENKTAATAGPLKKDGTPDKRYKANKK